MKLDRLRIGVRLGVGFGFVLTLFIAMLMTSCLVSSLVQNKMAQGFTDANEKVTLVTSMRAALYETVIAMHNLTLQTDVIRMQEEEGKVKAQGVRYQQYYQNLKKYGLSAAEQKIINDIAATDAPVDAALKQAMGFAMSFNSDGVAQVFSEQINPLNQRRLNSITELVKLQQVTVHDIIEKSMDDSNRALRFIILAAALVTLGGIAMALVITRSIVSPLRRSVAIAKTVAAGDLTLEIEVSGRDEISDLLQSLKEMNSNLYLTVERVRHGTDTIAIAASQIAAGNLDLSSRTEAQAGSLEETVASMDELTETVNHNGDTTIQANQLAESATSIAEKGGLVVAKVVETMGAINTSSIKIVEIISVIDSIAFQTNILALNAAVEAARAGEQGRGFAVVASEVRSLAQRSAEAAKQIKKLIGDSMEQVQHGVELVDQAGKTMGEVVDGIKRVSGLMGELTIAGKEQSGGILQINQAIIQMDQITQQNAALVEEAAAAAASLQDQASALVGVVSIFKIQKTQSFDNARTTSIGYLSSTEVKLLGHVEPAA